MFLKQLLKNTPSSHNDYISLQSALDSVVKTTTQLDVTCHRAENVLKIVEISKLISVVRFFTSFFFQEKVIYIFLYFFFEKENLLTPFRMFIREDDVTETRLDSSNSSDCKLYLFNDLLIFSEKRSKIYHNTSFPLSITWVHDRS